MGNFFSYENTCVQPSLSKDGKVWSGNEADLLNSLYDRCNTQDTKPTVDGIVVGGPVVVNMYRPALKGREYLGNTLKKDWNHFFKRN